MISSTGGKKKKIAVLALSSFLVSYALFASHLLDRFELSAYNIFSINLNPARVSGDVVIVEVDQKSLDDLNSQGVQWPWPRQVYAPLLEYMSDADAIFVDIIFSEPSSYGQDDDRIFAEAMKRSGNVYLPLFLSRKQKEMSQSDEDFIAAVALKDKTLPVRGRPFFSAVTPLDVLKSSAKGAGNVAIAPDADGVYRRVPLLFRIGENVIPHFVLGYLLNKGLVEIRGGEIFSGGKNIPLAGGNMLLKYYRGRPFMTFGASDIIRFFNDSRSGSSPKTTKGFFKGKKVFIGLTAPGLYDLKPTAVSAVSTGVFIHATAIENILRGDFITPAGDLILLIFMCAICLFTSYSVLKDLSIFKNLFRFLLSLCLVILIAGLLFRNSIYVNITSQVASLLVSFVVAAVYNYATAGKERLFIRKTFSQYMDRKIVDHILENPELIRPGGRKAHVTVFFADIAGFTSIAEKLPAEETAKILHTILNAFTEVIIKNGGVIDKYIGDCIMAFWGAPLETERDEINACRAALECMHCLEEINEGFRREGLFGISMRIGIHSGEAIVGNLGSDRLFDYTVIGDTVNLASRLESANKMFKTRITASEETVKKTGDLFFVRDLGLIEVKGKNLPVQIFELKGETAGVPPEMRQLVGTYHRGIALFRKRKWTEAMEMFDAVLSGCAEDGPSAFYRKRCERLVADPVLTEKWDVVKMTEK